MKRVLGEALGVAEAAFLHETPQEPPPRALRGVLAIGVGLLLYAMLVPGPAMENNDDPREGRKESAK